MGVFGFCTVCTNLYLKFKSLSTTISKHFPNFFSLPKKTNKSLKRFTKKKIYCCCINIVSNKKEEKKKNLEIMRDNLPTVTQRIYHCKFLHNFRSSLTLLTPKKTSAFDFSFLVSREISQQRFDCKLIFLFAI